MFSSMLRRISTVAVLVMATTTLVSGTATSAPVHPTSLSIRAAKAVVAPGGATTILGNLRVRSGQPLAGKTLTLLAKVGSDAEFLPIGTALSGARGRVALKVTPAETTRYRWVFAGDDANRPSRSGAARVAVRTPSGAPARRPSSLSIRAKRPVTSAAGGAAIAGRLVSRRTPLRNQIVVLLTRPDGTTGWDFVAAKRTGRYGKVAFGLRPAASARYRLLFQGTAKYRKARSGVVHVAVRSTQLTSAASAGSVAAGESATISGVLTKSGVAYPDQVVQLWGRPVGTHQKFAVLDSASTGPDGSVSFDVTPTSTMRYVLFFPRTADAPAAQSPGRTIVVS